MLIYDYRRFERMVHKSRYVAYGQAYGRDPAPYDRITISWHAAMPPKMRMRRRAPAAAGAARTPLRSPAPAPGLPAVLRRALKRTSRSTYHMRRYASILELRNPNGRTRRRNPRQRHARETCVAHSRIKYGFSAVDSPSGRPLSALAPRPWRPGSRNLTVKTDKKRGPDT